MERFNIPLKKRGPIMAAALLVGVTFAGFISGMIETPQSENAYLHEHLGAPRMPYELHWDEVDFDMPEQDKRMIEAIITQTERPISESGLKTTLTDRALHIALENICTPVLTRCNIPIRIGRRLKADHLNKDFRVVNVTETSQRIDLEFTQKTSQFALKVISDETRILRFYQTQFGWMQDGLKIVEARPIQFDDRKDKFREHFDVRQTGLNYYPASASWGAFWKVFPRTKIEADLEQAKTLNVNSLRIFLTHDYFNDLETREDGLTKLNAFLDMCAAKNIRVLVTLFDLRPDYSLSNWAADIDHIDAILSRMADHEAVWGIDLKNQPDLDFKNWGQGVVEAWLIVMARHIQTNYPHLAVTAGWSSAESATRLSGIFDVITYHEYQNPKGFETRLSAIANSAKGKPVMITELGSTIWHPPFIGRIGEAGQAKRLKRQLDQAREASGVFVWTLNDFDHVGREIVGPLPWRRKQQKHFGLVRDDETLRPAADILKAFGNLTDQAPAKLKP